MDLRDASHEEAVEAIRKAGNPVSFLVQSIIHRPRVSLDSSERSEGHSFAVVSPSRGRGLFLPDVMFLRRKDRKRLNQLHLQR